MAEIERTRAVVNSGESYDGRIIPAEQAAIDRPLRVREGADVEGSVYATTVSVDPDATVDGSVMASEVIELTGSHVRGEAGTPGKAVCEDARIDGTLTGKKVRLQGCIVRGNVVGIDVILEDSIVMGVATADRDLTIENSLCYTFRSGGDVTADGTMTVLPQASVSDELTLHSPVTVVGLGELDAGEEGTLPEMHAGDLHTSDGTQYLTLVPRVLNLSKVQDRLNQLETAVSSILTDTSSSTTASELLRTLEIDVDEVADNISWLN